MLIRDLVTIDEQAEFRNDVQLSDFDNQNDNMGLLRSFIFSYNTPQGWESAVGLLRMMLEVYTIAHQENRLVCIANYGHGKSHLALVLANYFSKPFHSREMEKVLEKLSKAIDRPSLVDRFKEFRQNRPEFLVIRLRGDMPGSLREQFLSNLEHALKEHTATASVRLPYWSDKARELLENLDPSQKAKATKYLAEQSTDLAGLLADVKQNRDQAYYQCLQLFTHLLGVEPNLGGQVSLGKLLKDVARDYCGEGKPLGGVCILFDEFSLYIQRHAQHGASGDLQDLLNGVEDLKNKAVFLAFSQHDPITVARNFTKSTQVMESLLKELNRIPKKILLYSLMESVIDAYLEQPGEAWRSFRADKQQVQGPLARASLTAMDMYRDRYEKILGWKEEKFDEIVTRGSFPLHPLTTALLCNLRLAGADIVGNPRTVLGFVFEQIYRKQNDAALVDGKINWVLPVYLVDYFKEYFGEQPYQMYLNARRNLPAAKPDEQDEQERLLKAILLQEAAGLKPHKDTQLQFLNEASGVPFGNMQKHLIDMRSARCVRYDDIKRTYSFWALNTDPDLVGRKLQKLVEGKEITLEMLLTLIKDQTSKTIPISVAWGHPEDWEAKEFILSRRYLTPSLLKELFPSYRININGELVDGVRGGVVWVIAENEEDLTWLRSNAAGVLDQAFPGPHPLPVVFKLPGRPYPGLLPAFQKLKALESMSEPDRKECGTEAYEFEKKRLTDAYLTDLIHLRGEPSNCSSIPHRVDNYIVPSAYRATLELQGRPSISQVLTECYNLAYRFSPPAFFTTYKNPARGANNLWKATKLVATHLLKNSLPSARHTSLQSDKIAKDLVEKFLWAKWNLVTVEYNIKEPEDHRIRKGWLEVEDSIPAGDNGAKVREILLPFLNPPYGYDYNTLTLLLCAWIGLNYHDLQFSCQTRIISIDDLIHILNPDTGKQNFVSEICGPQRYKIIRRDRSLIIKEAQTDVERARKETFGIEEAKKLADRLQVWSQDEGLPEEWRETARQTAANLTQSVEIAVQYEKDAAQIQLRIENDKDMQEFIAIQNKIRELKPVGQVIPDRPKMEELESFWRNGLTRRVESECHKLEKVDKLQEIGRNQDKLKQLKTTMKAAKMPNLQALVERSLELIAGREQELTLREQEAPILAEIRGMDTRVPLNRLFEYEERLLKIEGFSESTMKLRTERLALIQREISQLNTLVDGLIHAVESLNSSKMVGDWLEKRSGIYYRVEGTDKQKGLDQSQDQVGQIQEILTALNQITSRRPTSLEDARETARKLEELNRHVALIPGSSMQLVLSQAKTDLNNIVQQQVAKAHEWLMQQHTRFERGDDLYRLAQDINSPPSFLMNQERQLLETLRENVHKRQDQDVMAKIEHQFRQITDPELRQDCLKRLQEIIAEENGVTA